MCDIRAEIKEENRTKMFTYLLISGEFFFALQGQEKHFQVAFALSHIFLLNLIEMFTFSLVLD